MEKNLKRKYIKLNQGLPGGTVDESAYVGRDMKFDSGLGRFHMPTEQLSLYAPQILIP